MSSLRNSTPSDQRTEHYLAAARACILEFGWRRTTLTEVARRAGVSRMTIYRTWPDMGALLADLMTREWFGIAAVAHPGGARTPEAIASAAVATVQALRDNEFFVRIVELDPELLLPYLLSRRGRSQESLLEVLSAEIRAGQAEGLVRDGDPMTMARAITLAGHGSVFSAMTMVDDDISLDDLDGELDRMVRSFLEPS